MDAAVDTVHGMLYTACSFYDFLERLCVLTAGLPSAPFALNVLLTLCALLLTPLAFRPADQEGKGK